MLRRVFDATLSPVLARLFRRYINVCSKDIDITRKRLAAEDSASFVESELPLARSHLTKFDLLRASLAAVDQGPDSLRASGIYCEFGVYRGATINFIASNMASPVHGFDSFEGLPDDWRAGFRQGVFKLQSPPRVNSNVILHKGWFKDTIPVWLAKTAGPLAFLHIDCDLYSSTKTILDEVADRIVPGTVIQFDEYFNYPGWRGGEHKAFTEFCLAHKVSVEYLGYVGNDEQLAVRIMAIGEPAGVAGAAAAESQADQRMRPWR